jgi:hypothetical protein
MRARLVLGKERVGCKRDQWATIILKGTVPSALKEVGAFSLVIICGYWVRIF